MPNLEISTVVGCRMGCDYCPQKIHTASYKGERSMSLETFAKCLSKVPKNVDIHFAGMAEPWLNPNATDMLLMAHEQGHRIQVYTTLYGMGTADLFSIMDIPFVHFCLHLPDADGIMKFDVTPEYLNTLEMAITIPGRNFMCIGKVHPLVEKITGPVPDSSHTLISRAGNLKTLAVTPKKGKIICSSMPDKLDHNVLLPNGDVLLCCMMYDNSHKIGNLLTGSYDDLFESDEYKKVLRGLNDESIDIKCRKCEIAKEI